MFIFFIFYFFQTFHIFLCFIIFISLISFLFDKCLLVVLSFVPSFGVSSFCLSFSLSGSCGLVLCLGGAAGSVSERGQSGAGGGHAE